MGVMPMVATHMASTHMATAFTRDLLKLLQKLKLRLHQRLKLPQKLRLIQHTFTVHTDMDILDTVITDMPTEPTHTVSTHMATVFTRDLLKLLQKLKLRLPQRLKLPQKLRLIQLTFTVHTDMDILDTVITDMPMEPTHIATTHMATASTRGLLMLMQLTVMSTYPVVMAIMDTDLTTHISDTDLTTATTAKSNAISSCMSLSSQIYCSYQ